jgi:hypothetical protein
MKFFVASDHFVNLDQIAYVERQSGAPVVITLYFSAVASGPGGEPMPLSLVLRGHDAERLLKELEQT